MYSRCIYICPFYEHREKLSIRCEGGELRFPDGKATSDYVARYCAAEQWQKCSVAGMLLRYYDRIEDEDQRMRENSYKKRVDVFRYFRKSGDFGRDASVQLNGDMKKHLHRSSPVPTITKVKWLGVKVDRVQMFPSLLCYSQATVSSPKKLRIELAVKGHLKRNLSQFNRRANEFKKNMKGLCRRVLRADVMPEKFCTKKKAPKGFPSRVRRYGEGTALATLDAFCLEGLLPQKNTLAQKGPPRR